MYKISVSMNIERGVTDPVQSATRRSGPNRFSVPIVVTQFLPVGRAAQLLEAVRHRWKWCRVLGPAPCDAATVRAVAEHRVQEEDVDNPHDDCCNPGEPQAEPHKTVGHAHMDNPNCPDQRNDQEDELTWPFATTTGSCHEKLPLSKPDQILVEICIPYYRSAFMSI